VRLGSRAFDFLAALVERPGEVVGKEQLIARAWPQTVVEDSNLKIQVSALRRALGDGRRHRYLITVRGAATISSPRYDARKRFFTAPAPPVSLYDAAQSAVRRNAHDRPRRRGGGASSRGFRASAW